MKRTFTMLFAAALCALAVSCAGRDKDSEKAGDAEAEIIVTETPLKNMDGSHMRDSFSAGTKGSIFIANMNRLERLVTDLAGSAFPGRIVETVNFPDSLKDKEVSVSFSVPYRMDMQEMGAKLYKKVADIYGLKLDSAVRDTSGYKLSIADKKALRKYRTPFSRRRDGGMSMSDGIGYSIAKFDNIEIKDLAWRLGGINALKALVWTDEKSERGYDFEFTAFNDPEIVKSELEKYGLLLEDSTQELELIIIDGSAAK